MDRIQHLQGKFIGRAGFPKVIFFSWPAQYFGLYYHVFIFEVIPMKINSNKSQHSAQLKSKSEETQALAALFLRAHLLTFTYKYK